MRYVVLRDDDTNFLTPPECLERLYRPFLDAPSGSGVKTDHRTFPDQTGFGKCGGQAGATPRTPSLVKPNEGFPGEAAT